MLSIGYLRAAALLAAIVMPVLVFTQRAEDVVVSPHAKRLHDRAIVIDSHDDTTQRLLFDKTFDIGARPTNGNNNIPRHPAGARAATTRRCLVAMRFATGARHTDGNIDIPRMRDGGLDALFFSIWVPSDVTGAPAVKQANALIAAVLAAVRTT